MPNDQGAGDRVKAITLHQPWASLIAAGVKTIETRSWSTPYRGIIAIHAGVTMPRLPMHPTKPTQRREPNAAELRVHELDDNGEALCWCGHDTLKCLRYGLCTLRRGHIVAIANLSNVVPMVALADRADVSLRDDWHVAREGDTPVCVEIGVASLMLWREGQRENPFDASAEIPFGHYEPGRFAWILDNVVPVIGPCPVKGRQGLWEWNPGA